MAVTDEERLALLKTDLQLMTGRQDAYLRQLLGAAADMIGREGIALRESVEDETLRAMYAAYLYRKRATDNAPMPRMLRYALNNRLMAQKAGDADAP